MQRSEKVPIVEERCVYTFRDPLRNPLRQYAQLLGKSVKYAAKGLLDCDAEASINTMEPGGLTRDGMWDAVIRVGNNGAEGPNVSFRYNYEDNDHRDNDHSLLVVRRHSKENPFRAPLTAIGKDGYTFSKLLEDIVKAKAAQSRAGESVPLILRKDRVSDSRGFSLDSPEWAVRYILNAAGLATTLILNPDDAKKIKINAVIRVADGRLELPRSGIPQYNALSLRREYPDGSERGFSLGATCSTPTGRTRCEAAFYGNVAVHDGTEPQGYDVRWASYQAAGPTAGIAWASGRKSNIPDGSIAGTMMPEKFSEVYNNHSVASNALYSALIKHRS